ncbi:hypothetical protein SH139x_004805 [Planctomycetaceae bacterium SH139]
MIKWVKHLYDRCRERVLPGFRAAAQYESSPEPKPLQRVRERPVESIVGKRLTSIHCATWFTTTRMKANFVYGLSDATFVRFGFWIDELKTCEEVVLNDDYHEVVRPLYGNGDHDPRWHNREIVDIVVPRDINLRHEDEQGLLLDSGLCIFQSTSEPRGCSPYVAIAAINSDDVTGLIRLAFPSLPIQTAHNNPMDRSGGSAAF